jgi:hypothetical protein
MSSIARTRLIIACATCGLLLAATSAWAEPQSPIRLVNEYVECAIGGDGYCTHFVDRRTGTNLIGSKKTPLAQVMRQGKACPVTAVSYADGTLSMKFGDSGISAAVQVTAKPHYFRSE